MKTLIIAEVGVNHNGDMDLAKQLIDVASDAGADFVKFQTFNTEKIVTPTALKAKYQSEATESQESQYSMLKRLELSREHHKLLMTYCKEKSVGFLSTGFDIESIDFLVSLGVNFLKIPSGEITNLPYLRHIGRYGKSVILSTGMATLGEVDAALNILQRTRSKN